MVAGDSGQIQLFERHGQSHFDFEVDDRGLLIGFHFIIQAQLRHNAKRHFFAMHHAGFLASGHIGQEVPNHVRRGQSAAFETQAGQQHVGFDDLFDGRRDDMMFHVAFGVETMFQQNLKTKSSEHHGGHGRPSTGDIHRPRLEGRFTFHPCRQRVPHTGDKRAHRPVGHHLRVHQHDVGIERPAIETHEVVIVIVPDRSGAGR